jgi:hypothetical protein
MAELRKLAVICALAFVASGHVARAEESLRIVPIVAGEEVVVSFELAEGYTPALRQAISSGLLTTFTYNIELQMQVAGWRDRTIETAVVSMSDRYDNLTRKHTLTRVLNGRVIESIVTDDEATVRQFLTTAKRLPLCRTSKLDPSRDYNVLISAQRKPLSTSLLGWAANVVGRARFTFVP